MKRSKGRYWLTGALACALGWPVLGSAADDITVGVFVSSTGALAPLGVDMERGYRIAVKEHPNIKGTPIRLVVEDDQGNAATGLMKAQKLVIQDRAKVLVGGTSSAVVLGLAAQAARLNVPIVSTNSQAVQTTGAQCSRFIFRTNPNDAMVANGTRILLQKRPELAQKKWFVVYHDFVWGRSNKEQFEKIPGVKVVGEAGRSMGTADWSSTISEIQNSGADAIYLALAVGDDMPAFLRQARSYGLKQFMLPPLGMPDSMLEALGTDTPPLVTGGLFASWTTQDKDPKMASFVKAYTAAYHTVPGPQAIQAYAGMQLVLTAMEAAPSLSPDDLIASIEKSSVDTVIGKLAIRKADHQGTVGTYMAESAPLKDAPGGAKVGWHVIQQLPWDMVKVPLNETGCKGL
ncbi:ABC transporter substrate-binding protein [Paraburkholderia susongensis]|uniref:Amino acid/amide ABC transporter substrate-binding protein, HAAT family n=1 Tax=Paraburkholderia susongensis TaxID=1515439 RepID=A0A1X7KLP8_9BURK|nr:ABC transporter substrate-binding protein [Paraburkholderia susongensis]SMG42063.1 amino acid/amide ABC transporter substrate-binding protein, HAAT family [Paraburkholderia susongensis]